MISADDARHTVELNDYFIILPELALDEPIPERHAHMMSKGKFVAPGFVYASHTNNEWLSLKDIKSFLNSYKYQEVF